MYRVHILTTLSLVFAASNLNVSTQIFFQPSTVSTAAKSFD